MSIKKSMKLSTAAYFRWFGLSIFGFLANLIGAVIAYRADFVLGIIFCLPLIFYFGSIFFIRFLNLRFLEINTSISKEDLFYVIDLLVALEGWEYGDIQGNEVTIFQKNPKKQHQKYVLKIIYFPEKIWVHVIHEPIAFLNFSIKSYTSKKAFIENLILQKINNQDVAAFLKQKIALEKQLQKQGTILKYDEDKGGCFGMTLGFLFLASPILITSDFFKENSMLILCFIVAFLLFGYLETWHFKKQ